MSLQPEEIDNTIGLWSRYEMRKIEIFIQLYIANWQTKENK